MIYPLIAMTAIAMIGTAVQGAQMHQSEVAGVTRSNAKIAHQMEVDAANNLLTLKAGKRAADTITYNQRIAYENGLDNVFQIELQAAKTASKLKVQAAASGTAGSAVDSAQREQAGFASRAITGVEMNTDAKLFELERSRKEVEATVMSRTTNNIYQPFTQPNANLAALSVGFNTASAGFKTFSAGGGFA